MGIKAFHEAHKFFLSDSAFIMYACGGEFFYFRSSVNSIEHKNDSGYLNPK